jgi:hypothetical protein
MRFAWLPILLACGAPRPEADGIARALQRGVAPSTTSVLVMRGDAIVYERYFDGATAATLHDTRSATKSLTALAIGIAIDPAFARVRYAVMSCSRVDDSPTSSIASSRRPDGRA